MSRFGILIGLVSLTAAWADSRSDALDRIFAVYTHPDSPGCAVGVFQNGEALYRRGYGMADLEHAVPMSPASAVYLASVSKQFTAAAVLDLVEQGKLKLTDPVRKLVPELPAYAAPITVDHLLHHTSGLRDYLALAAYGPKVPDDYHVSNAEFLEIMARQKGLNFEPGAEHFYSNSGYVLLSIIVERVSGRTLRQYANDRIFGPRGMNATHFHDDHAEPILNRAIGYSRFKKGGPWRIDAATLDVVGDGGVFSTVDDFLLWDRSFPETLLARGILANGASINYAEGVVHSTHGGLPVIVHGGGLRGYRTVYVRFPSEKFSVVCLCNASTANPTAYAWQIAQIYLGGKLSPEPEGSAPESVEPGWSTTAQGPLPDLAGTYRSEETQGTVRVATEGGKLILRAANLPKIELKALGDGRFAAEAGSVEFRGDKLIVNDPRARGLVFQRVR